MKASQALAVLVDPENLMQNLVVVPEGARVRQIVKTIVTRPTSASVRSPRPSPTPEAIGLPPEAEGNPEGYLYPATYTVPPKQDALGLITQMVTKTVEVEQSLDIESRAKELGLTPEEVLTVASILEYEANRSEDYPKVARVLYNRLKKDMPLQLDSTVSYVSKRSGDVWTTAAERSNTSLYNTYEHAGLPPGPIGSPGEETIEAALNPADGDWLYFVPGLRGRHHPVLRDATPSTRSGSRSCRSTAVAARTAEPASMRCAVLGSPIAHSLSPALHRAAYDHLGLDWTYDAVEVESSGLERFLDGLDGTWRGLSLTMPLKRTVVPLRRLGRRLGAARPGSANTVLLDGRRRHGLQHRHPGRHGGGRRAGARRRCARRW